MVWLVQPIVYFFGCHSRDCTHWLPPLIGRQPNVDPRECNHTFRHTFLILRILHSYLLPFITFRLYSAGTH